jgi:DNA repair exonuclease SbcCD nuclease subunit
MKILAVGDAHATVEELPDCQALLARILEVCKLESPDCVLFLGDQHHNHAVVRVEVIEFWRQAYTSIRNVTDKRTTNIYCLVGNHDRPGDSSSTATAMAAYMDLVHVIFQPDPMWPGVLLMPFFHDGEAFIKSANSYSIKTMFCHQTFAGSTYENGFYAEDGINVDSLNADRIISGHIHTAQEFGRVWYPGAPRWRTKTDANQDRNLWVLELEDGEIIKKTPYTTRGYCKQLANLIDVEGQPLCWENGEPATALEPLIEPVVITVDIRGTQAYVDQSKLSWKARGARVRASVTTASTPKVRESEGISKALQRFLKEYNAKNGTPPEVLAKMAEERLHV